MRSLLSLSAALLFGAALLVGCDSGYGLDDGHKEEEKREPPKKWVTAPDAAAVALDPR